MTILIHGFNVKDPSTTTGRLKPFVKNPVMFNYGWFGLFSVLLHNKDEAYKLKQRLNSKDSQGNACVVFGHSNGCAIAVEAARQGAVINALVCINPALKRKTIFPKTIGKVLVIHTKHDKPTRIARFFDKVPLIQLIVPNAWGAMGAKGYSGNNSRVENWDLSEVLEGHSDFLTKDNLNSYMPKVNEWLEKTARISYNKGSFND